MNWIASAKLTSKIWCMARWLGGYWGKGPGSILNDTLSVHLIVGQSSLSWASQWVLCREDFFIASCATFCYVMSDYNRLHILQGRYSIRYIIKYHKFWLAICTVKHMTFGGAFYFLGGVGSMHAKIKMVRSLCTLFLSGRRQAALEDLFFIQKDLKSEERP